LTSLPLTVFAHQVSEPLGGASPIGRVPGGQGGAVLQAKRVVVRIMSAILAFILRIRISEKRPIYTICWGSAIGVPPSVVSFRQN